jgi:hypothetical protein
MYIFLIIITLLLYIGDNNVRYRRLCIALRIIRYGGETSKLLSIDLGFLNNLNIIKPFSENEILVIEELKKNLI